MTLNTQNKNGVLTSFSQLFCKNINGITVNAIEVPIFQRDYAQGRNNDQVNHVREQFIADLCTALDSDKDIHLDFVFGDVVDGTLYPLDGQQRLTMLFLLHCYLAWHLLATDYVEQPWHSFHYATRPGARAFCQFLTKCRPELSLKTLSEWLCDQAAYLSTWKHDPTIQGMLVVLDNLHQHYREKPPELLRNAWQRLVDPNQPAISFLLLPVASQSLDNIMYVKMNSRGKPLTEFENFKADLEALLKRSTTIPKDSIDVLSHKIDTDWTDLFWEYRDHNHLIDEEFIRYFRFLFEVQAWKQGIDVHLGFSDLKAVTDLSEQLLGTASVNGKNVFDWIGKALDVWLDERNGGVSKPKDIKLLFSQLFTRVMDKESTALRIFNFQTFDETNIGVDMFHACCKLYGSRPWSLAHTVLFYGVLVGLMGEMKLPELQLRLRLLRNLIEASEDEIRADNTRNNMPALLNEVDKIMAGGPLMDLGVITTFNQVQVRNECAKNEFLVTHPSLRETLYDLEDHELLRGGLTAFDLDPTQSEHTFKNRAIQFSILFDTSYNLVIAALLTKGNNGRCYDRSSGHVLTFLGAPRARQSGLWGNHWRARRNENPHPSATSLAALLDEMARGTPVQSVIDIFLKNPNTSKDWRYYIVKYPVMCGQELEFSGSYVVSAPGGYSMCMLKSDSCDNRSNHHDGYLMALVNVAGVPPESIANEGWPRCFPGYETNERYLRLRNSGIQIRCINAGWQFSAIPDDDQQSQTFDEVAKHHPYYQSLLYAVPQENGIDTEDRIELGAQLLKELVDAGL